MAKPAKEAMLPRSTENTRKLAEHAEAIRSLRKKTIDNIIEIGKRLVLAKDLAGPGNWLSWLKDEFDWSERTARNYMQVARSAKVADLNVPISSLYQLTAPSTPPAARQAVAWKAEKGKVQGKEVVQAIRKAKPKPEPDEDDEPGEAPDKRPEPQSATDLFPNSVLGNRARRQLAKEAALGPVSLNRQHNLITRELADFFMVWCSSTAEWIRQHQAELDHKNGAEVKESLIMHVNFCAGELQKILNPLYRQDPQLSDDE